MNILFIATYGDFLATFEYSNIKICQELGHTIHCAANFSDSKYNLKTSKLDEIGVIKHDLSFSRSPFNISNIKEFFCLVDIIKTEKIEAIDTHNAVISAFARIAAKKCNINRVIYTPHSFFFFKGCGLKNRIIFKNIEKILSRITDLIITINKEDFENAKKFPVRGKTIYVPGIGIDTKKIFSIENKRKEYCKEFLLPEDAIIFISVGELINRKNHRMSIEAFSKLNIPNSYYLICGIGELENELNSLIKNLNMENKIKLLGYRLDAKEIMKSSDFFIFPSFQEGLPVALMEAMACGLPCIVSNIRGNIDLVEENVNGWLFNPYKNEELSACIEKAMKQSKMYNYYKINNIKKIKNFDINIVRSIMIEEYTKIL